MAAVLIARVLGQRRPTGSTWAWLLAIVLIPYVGVPLYLLLGGRKLKRRSATKPRLYAPRPTAEPPVGSITHMLWALGAPPTSTASGPK